MSGPGKLYQTFSSIRDESNRDPITAVFLQDHRIMAAKAEAVRTTAKKFGLLALTAFAPPGADGRGHGGVMIVIPHEAIMPPHQPQARGTQNTTQTQAERKAEEDIRAATDLHARCAINTHYAFF